MTHYIHFLLSYISVGNITDGDQFHTSSASSGTYITRLYKIYKMNKYNSTIK